jgi:hypothetical protein
VQKAGNFLSKFKNIVPPERSVKRALLSVLKNECGIVLKDKEIKVRGKMVYLSTSPAARSEIALQKSKILDALHKKLGGNRRIVDLR